MNGIFNKEWDITTFNIPKEIYSPREDKAAPLELAETRLCDCCNNRKWGFINLCKDCQILEEANG